MSKQAIHPPRAAAALLRIVVHEVDNDAVLGDLEETYREVVKRYGRSAANRWYWSQVVRSAPRFLVSSIEWSLIMMFNYVRTTVRHLLKHKGHASINVFGLAIGLAACLLIFRFVVDEVGFDGFHAKGDRLYRLNWDFNWNEMEGIGSGTPPPLAARLKSDVPEIEDATRIYPVSPMVVRRDDRFFVEDRIVGADSNFFNVFSFSLIEGSPDAALATPNSVVLTEETARKYFGSASAFGKTITIGESGRFLGRPYDETFTVTGIARNTPANSHIQFDMVTSMSSHPQVAFFDWSWIWMNVVTYAVVSPDASIPRMETKLSEIVATHAPEAFERVGFSYDEMIKNGGRWNFVFQPMSDVYLGSADVGNRLGPLGSRQYLTVFSIVAGFILLIACINFMNLTTAQSVTRAKEIGVRKVLGSVRRNLMSQFMTEAMCYAALGMLMAIGIATLLLRPFGHFTGKDFAVSLLEPAWLPPALLGLTLFVGLLAGSYPSLYLSAFRPIEVLKSRISSREGKSLRHGLVVFQFAVSIALIACTLVVRNQIKYFTNAELGFDKESVLVISNLDNRLGSQAELFVNRVRQNSGVAYASMSTGVPPYWGFQDYYKVEGRNDEQFSLVSYMVDNDFEETLGLELVAGRGFSPDFPGDSASVVLNQTAVAQLGWDDPIGRTIRYPSRASYTVIGVVRDFNFLSMKQPITPFALFHETANMFDIPDSYVVVRALPDRLDDVIASLEGEWATVAPGTPFEYSFLDENLEAQYGVERRLGMLFLIFSGIAIFVACLGLLGLAAFTVQQRTKEIGIRKTFGASTARLLYVLSRDFSRWVLAANLIAWPAAWYFMEQWLQGFAFHVDLGYGVFLASGLVALAIALGTVGYHSWRAAVANPIDALRYE